MSDENLKGLYLINEKLLAKNRRLKEALMRQRQRTNALKDVAREMSATISFYSKLAGRVGVYDISAVVELEKDSGKRGMETYESVIATLEAEDAIISGTAPAVPFPKKPQI